MLFPSSSRSVRRVLTAPLLLPLALALACTGGKSAVDQGHYPVGSIQYNKATGTYFIVDDNSSGVAAEPRLARVMWGRLVDVYGMTTLNERKLMQRDFVVDPDLLVDGFVYQLVTNPVTTGQELTILRNIEDTSSGGGREQFFSLLRDAEANLRPVFDNGLHESGTFTMIPRNGAVVLQLDDLIDPDTLDFTTLKVFVGVPTVVPYEGRVFVDQNHGDVADFDSDPGREFYSTRIIVDTTVSEVESFREDPPLTVNNIGLPGSVDSNRSNLQVRIPTLVNAPLGQPYVLRNPSGHALSSKNSGTVDHGSGTVDITRLARSGGDTNQTSDPYNGFLRDEDPPLVIGQQPVSLLEPPVSTNSGEEGDEFLIPFVQFETVACAQTPRLGDVLQQPGIFAEVIAEPAPPANGLVTDLQVRLLVWPRAWDEPGLTGPREWEKAGGGPARFLTPFDPVLNDGQQKCFVSIFPNATGFPDDPVDGVFPSSTMTVRFSEPMDVGAMSALDSIFASRVLEPVSGHQWVVGSIAANPSLLEFTFMPARPFSHNTGSSEPYWLFMGAGPLGPVDLAGNEVQDPLPRVRFELEPSASGLITSGRATRFSSADEETPIADPNANPPELEPLAEWSGQIAYNLTRQTIVPRSVTRFEGAVDRTQTMVAAMNTNVAGNQLPLSNFGAKMQTVWRHEDMNLPITDDSSYNIDVEGLNWAPLGGQAVVDTFDLFEIRVSHSSRYPDEAVTPPPIVPYWPTSGLQKFYDQNQLDLNLDPQKVLHPRYLGYSIDPGQVFLSSTETKMMPFPFNRGNPSEQVYWTWRDTALYGRGGDENFGLPSLQWYLATGATLPLIIDCAGNCPGSMLYATTYGQWYDTGQIQSVGLPMLLEFRTWPDAGAVANNRFETSFGNVPRRPYFRAFSAGGIDKNLEKVYVDPDLENQANGGFNPNSVPLPGEKTPGQDSEFTLGSADFVVRVSRSYSLWFQVVDGSGQVFTNSKMKDVVMEPAPAEQPLGTSISASFRGATAVAQSPLNKYEDIRYHARRLDLYGDHYPSFTTTCVPPVPPDNHNFLNRCTGQPQVNKPVTFLHGSDVWTQDLAELDGALYYQVRLTFVANAQTGLVPELASFGVTWTK